MAKSATRLYAIIARNKPVGVVLRRGPSRQVQLLKWDLKTDTLLPGQWFKGRVYERRCDLSPNGEYLIYFAANYKPPFATWTAISKVPFFSALALWPKGDAWGGGGLFDADNKGITLNHRSAEMELAEAFSLPQNFRVRPHGERSGWGEDDPIVSHRLIRDGWSLDAKGKEKENKFGSKVWIEFVDPRVWVKKSNLNSVQINLELHGIKESQGPWYVQKLKYHKNGECLDLGCCDWADLSEKGTVYFSQEGLLRKRLLNGQTQTICDLSDNTFEAIVPPEDVTKW